MLRISPSTRVLGAIALLAAFSLVLGGVVFAVTEGEQNRLSIAMTRLDRVHAGAHVASDDADEQESALDDYIVTGSDAALIRFYASVRRETEALQSLEPDTFDLSEIASALSAAGELSLDWRSVIAEPAIEARRINNQAGLDRFASVAVYDHTDVETASNHVDDLLDEASAGLTAQASAVGDARLVGTVVSFGVFLVAFLLAIIVVHRFGRALERDARHAIVLNRFTEVTSFAGEDRQIGAANLAALGRLVHPDASVTHVLNRSLDRAVPEATTGNAVAEVLAMHDMGRCAGMLRGTMYVSDDLSDDLSVHCPVYPAPKGTLACIPLSSGEAVGAVHLYWAKPNALPLKLRAPVARITEHAALTIGNRRLLAALHGQANTDPRTGLANSRAFDLAVESTLAGRAGDEDASVLMLDLDHFKLFNDRHGHPAGDEALRSFAAVLRSCMRERDVAARYGGEEFAVLLRGVDRQAAMAIAERIRARTESTIIAVSPGLTDRITVSVGVASAPEQGLERVVLLRLADEALYRAMAGGRNRVATAGDDADDGDPEPITPIERHQAAATTEPRARRRA